ncbi:MAG: hypothetical protein CBE24_02670 [bacterium TMED264]|nr:MAG: hypothetical protein CBE24_02670 [bacterium TMED264]|tara:strand:+ start:536 stop:838 length:303 start_codon:yes stop_codon:yes gene_type:complete
MNKTSVSTEELFMLFQDVKRLFPKTDIDDFGEIIEQDGYWDTLQRIKIQKDSFEELCNNWNGKGFSHIKRLYQLYKRNQLHKNVDKDLLRLSRIYSKRLK